MRIKYLYPTENKTDKIFTSLADSRLYPVNNSSGNQKSVKKMIVHKVFISHHIYRNG